jgi:hypothetical protein
VNFSLAVCKTRRISKYRASYLEGGEISKKQSKKQTEMRVPRGRKENITLFYAVASFPSKAISTSPPKHIRKRDATSGYLYETESRGPTHWRRWGGGFNVVFLLGVLTGIPPPNEGVQHIICLGSRPERGLGFHRAGNYRFNATTRILHGRRRSNGVRTWKFVFFYHRLWSMRSNPPDGLSVTSVLERGVSHTGFHGG